MSAASDNGLATASKSTDSADGHVTLKREDTDTVAEQAAAIADETLEAQSPSSALVNDGYDSEKGDVSTIDVTDEASVLKGLTEGVRDQTDLERDITHRANIALNEQEDERDNKRIERAKANKEKLLNQRRTQTRRLQSEAQGTMRRRAIQGEVDRLDEEVAALDKDIEDIQKRIDTRHQDNEDGPNNDQAGGETRQPGESQRAFLLRTGKITPFSRVSARETTNGGDLEETLMDAEDELELEDQAKDSAGPQSHQNLKLPGFMDLPSAAVKSEFGLRARKRRRGLDGSGASSAVDSEDGDFVHKSTSEAARPSATTTEDEDAAFLDDDDDNDSIIDVRRSSKKSKTKTKKEIEDLTGIDDGNEANYQARLDSWVDRRSRARRHKEQKSEEEVTVPDDNEEEWFKPSPDTPDHQFANGLKMPGDIYPSLFAYQKTGVQWLGEMYEQQVGGILGDEMGLGKTIQIIAFIAALHYSKKLTKPVVVVAPATVLRQWVNEFHLWWPALRVSILHTSGSGMLNVASEARIDDEERYFGRKDKKPSKGHKSAKRIVDRVVQQGHVLVTTYAGLQTYGDILIPVKWGYAVLDEGHKIRNPNTAITVYCKELQTSNRIILSGTPMQNNLVELWSLFDFVFPMRLGTLVNFRQQFEVPIKLGGYANATNLQILTAEKCAETLKETISQYLLQRFKVDVAADLPKKTEQVLFCKLTKPQREAYELFLSSEEMTSILSKTRQSLYGIDILRKICNHPDLLDPSLRNKEGYKWGNPNKSGKMQILKPLLEIWKKKGDKVLLFSQGVQMLNIIERFVQKMDGFSYLRMDGSTNVKDRQTMVDQFNNNPEIDVFLLTTKVGGLGVNLTGANRVIIFDPDWNPSTDVQARERAWRLGQKKEVTIYRLMMSGTIEEKIYHRQIFKQFLSDKILKDPKQRQTAFQAKDLYDLFTLGSATEDGTTETGNMFQGTQAYSNGSAPVMIEKPSFTKAHAYTTDTGVPALIQRDPNTSMVPKAEDGISLTNDDMQAIKVEEDNDVLAITGLSHMEDYHGEGTDRENQSDDQRIMAGLLASSGVHFVLEHDQIINGKKKVQADRGIIEKEAKKYAAQAAAELRRAGEIAMSTPIGTVTWTGEVGEGGRPQNIRRGGAPSSSSILSNLAARQGLNSTSSPSSSRNLTPPPSNELKPRDWMRMIPAYIRRQGGSVPSQMLIVHFDNMCRTAQNTVDFKACLQEVAKLEKGANNGRGRGRWVLKEEFRAPLPARDIHPARS